MYEIIGSYSYFKDALGQRDAPHLLIKIIWIITSRNTNLLLKIKGSN